MDRRKQLFTAVLALVVATLAYRAFFGAGSRGGAPKNARQADDVIVAFGDGHALRLGISVAGKPLINLGKDGDTSVAAAARIGEALAEKPNYLVVALGSVDLDQRLALDETLGALELIFGKAQEAGAMVVYVPVEPPPGTGDNWLMAIRDLCRTKGVLWGQARVGDSLAPYL